MILIAYNAYNHTYILYSPPPPSHRYSSIMSMVCTTSKLVYGVAGGRISTSRTHPLAGSAYAPILKKQPLAFNY